MKTFIELLTGEVGDAFEKAGYKRELGKVTVSNRPDLCEYQCNGAMAGAKEYHKAPIMIANDVAMALAGSPVFSEVTAVNPGFLNMKVSSDYLSDYLKQMSKEEKLGVNVATTPLKIVIDYGGPNVAKPLHVGHLRSAIIGEAVKRICKFVGHDTIGDIHMGDWGLQMGLIIHELSVRKPELCYFDASFEGEYPKEAPFTISELEEIYPTASGKSKTDEQYKAKAMEATYKLQHGDRGCLALWQHIMNVSVADLKKNYNNLNVNFELWKGEADADPYIAPMVERMKEQGFMYESEGAFVIDVKEENDQKEMPPCMILKSDGASLYTTTDLATLVQREEDYHPDRIIYVVDKRQELHFDQVFRAAKKTGIVPGSCDLKFIGFGTMNGKDGKPFKTREGGVMRLESLISDIEEQMYQKMRENKTDAPEEEARATSKIVGLAAIKYGDLSNQATKDYVFDPERFTSFEGDTGPYLLYTIVRIKSILSRYTEGGGLLENVDCNEAVNPQEKDLQKVLAGFNAMIQGAYDELAPHRICAYIYELANAFNRFYHETRILAEEDEKQKSSWIALLLLTKRVMETAIDILGFEAPERM